MNKTSKFCPDIKPWGEADLNQYSSIDWGQSVCTCWYINKRLTWSVIKVAYIPALQDLRWSVWTLTSICFPGILLWTMVATACLDDTRWTHRPLTSASFPNLAFLITSCRLNVQHVTSGMPKHQGAWECGLARDFRSNQQSQQIHFYIESVR